MSKKYIADKFVKTGGTGLNVLLDDGNTAPLPSGGSGGTKDFVATGTIGSGDVVGLKADGTVEIIGTSITAQSWGTKGTTNPGNYRPVNGPGVAWNPQENVVVFIWNNLSTDDIYIVAASIDGTTLTFGTEYILNANMPSFWATDIIYDPRTGKMLAIFDNDPNAYVQVVEIDGATKTVSAVGTPKNFDAAGMGGMAPALVYDESSERIVLITNSFKAPTNYAGWVYACEINADNTVTVGTGVQYTTSSIDEVDGTYDPVSERVVISFCRFSTYGLLTAKVDPTDNSITLGDTNSFDTDPATGDLYQGVTVAMHLVANRGVLVYEEQLANRNYALAFEINASTGAITIGTGVQVDGDAEREPMGLIYSPISAKVSCYYSDGANHYQKYIDVTPETNTIVLGTEYKFEDFDGISYLATTYSPELEKIILFGRYDLTADEFNYTMVQNPEKLSTNILSTIGIANEAIANTATGKVAVLGGINADQTGLTPGLYYYVDYQGNITTTPSVAFDYKVLGRAVSATEILVEVDNEFDITDYTITKSQISDFVVNTADLGDTLSGSFTLPTGDNAIDFGAYIHYDKTLDSNWAPTFTSPVKGKTITIIATGGTTNTLTLPASVKGDISAFDCTLTNQLQIYCLDDTTPVYSVGLLNW